jgi:CRP/FNR family transcriptional regulator, cyclic AMP receptor protein
MTHDSPETEHFKLRLRQSLIKAIRNLSAIEVDKHDNVYTVGDERYCVYFIEKGQIKLVMLSPEGRGCMLAVHGSGDLFGELCLSGVGSRPETATAMENSVLREIPAARFLGLLAEDSLLEEFVKYLAVRIADQQQSIANLVTIDSETRLGATLLNLARKFGKRESRNVRIELKISHEELAAMVGTTRPRVTSFIQRFRTLGLIESSIERNLVIREKRLTDYLGMRAEG